MFKNGVECISGVLNLWAIDQGPEKQQQKTYFGEKLFLSDDNKIPSYTSDVLRKVEGSHIPEGGWVGGETWFGKITTVVDVY